MAYADCIEEINRAMGEDKLSEKELVELGDYVANVIKNKQAANVGEDMNAAVLSALKEVAEADKIRAAVEKRNAIKNKLAFMREIDIIKSRFAHNPAEGLLARTGGSVTGAAEGKDSLSAQIHQLQGYYVQGLRSELDSADLVKLAASGEFDDMLYRAKWELSKEAPDNAVLAKLPKEVVEIAKALDRWQEKARYDANNAGAWIGKLEGRVTRRSHDQAKIAKAGSEQWTRDVSEWLDWERTMPDLLPEERAKELARLHSDFATGEHLKFREGGSSFGPPGYGNVGKKMSHDRVLHFKDADAEFAYHSAYGRGTALENVVNELDHMARDTALMRRFGPNAKQTFDAIYDDIAKGLRESGDDAGRIALGKRKDWIDRHLWGYLTGEARIPVDMGVAKASQGVRNALTMARLPFAILSQFGDSVSIALAHKNLGGSMFGGIVEAMKGWGDMFRPYFRDDKELAAYMGVMLDSMRDFHFSRYDPESGVPGALSKATNTFFRLNLMHRAADKQRIDFMGVTAHRLATRMDTEFDALEGGLRQLLGEYGIDKTKWDIVRKAETNTWRGADVLTPEGLKALPLTEFDPLVPGRKTDAARMRAQDDLINQLRTFYSDQTHTAVLNPDDMTSAMLIRGFNPGTMEGEALRHVMMFKSFTALFMRKVLGRELYGHGLEKLPLHQQLFHIVKSGNTDAITGLANAILWSTAFGYGVMVMKDTVKGRTPRWPDDPEEAVKITMAALAQGGGLGIYGDFLFGEAKSRFGRGGLETFLGPTWGVAEDVFDLAKGDGDKKAKAAKLAFSMVPNLAYTKTAFDFAITYQAMEWLNPGSVARMENRIKQENDQTYYFSPSQFAR